MRIINYFLPLLLVYSCNSETTPTTPQGTATAVEHRVTMTDEQAKNAAIVLAEPQSQKISSTMRVAGRIDVPPQNMFSVSVPIGGYLTATKLLPGMQVRKGDVIAVLEDQQFIQLQQEYLATKAKLEAAEADFTRQKELNESKASSDKVLQQAKSEYKALSIAHSALAEKLRLININPASLSEQKISRSIRLTAPFNGFVSKVNVHIGRYVQPTDVIFELVDPSSVQLILRVFEKDLPSLSIGQKIVAFTNTHPEQRYNCSIMLISKDVSEDRTAEVYCSFSNSDRSLLPGMYMNAEIAVSSDEQLTVPEEAVVSFEGDSYVFVPVEKNIYDMKRVVTGSRQDGKVGLRNPTELQGQRVVVKGAYTLLMMLKNTAEE